MNEVIEMLSGHRSVRKFVPRPISEKTVQWIIKSAQFASTSDHMQTYTIIRITAPSLRSRLAELSGNQSCVMTCPLLLVFCADLYRLKLAAQICEVEVRFDTADLLIASTVDVALAAQNAFTAAESIGLGGVYIGGIRNNISEVSRLLNLPNLAYPVFGLCFGFPAETPAQKPRLPTELVFNSDSYTQSIDTVTEEISRYDEHIKAYYEARGSSEQGWTEKMISILQGSGQRRGEVGEFLIRQGFGIN